VWLERNSRIFEDVQENNIELWHRIQDWVALWISQTKGFTVYSSSYLLEGVGYYFAIVSEHSF